MFERTDEGRRDFVAWLRRNKIGKVVMAASGGYGSGPSWRGAAKVDVRIVDPKRVRSFARSAGRLAKNDSIDADTIAWFAETFNEAAGQAYDAAREKLQQMVNTRQATKDILVGLTNQGEHELPVEVQRLHTRLAKVISTELSKLEAEISALIDNTGLPKLRSSLRCCG
nr:MULTISPECIES: transposase [unclassified Bradyrhizobium]